MVTAALAAPPAPTRAPTARLVGRPRDSTAGKGKAVSRVATTAASSSGQPSTFLGEGFRDLGKAAAAASSPAGSRPLKGVVTMGNPNAGKGVFAPIVVLARNVIGQKQFNQLRGKGIALHSQVITEFCKSIGADGKQRQALIRLAKKNGEKLGFLA
eukprot:SM000214S06775  [mRNA]  locus=s214:204138:204796:+ [translate_table: standard]